MPPRVAYWTSAFESDMEAVASEVRVLRRRFPGSIAWGLSRRNWLQLSFCGCSFHPRLHWLFRIVTRCFEPAFQMNHVFGSVGDWFYLQSRKWRPTVLTVATHRPPVERKLLDRIACFVVEHPGGEKTLTQQGVDPRRVRMILPPVDLTRFVPVPAPDGPFTVLFASSPEKESYLEARGVPQILDAAARRPDMRFRLLWRPWGDTWRIVEDQIRDRGLRNVAVQAGVFRDMARQYQNAHAVIAPFTDPARCKPAPNSVTESLACGRPALVTPTVGLAEFIAETKSGLVSEPSGECLADNLDRLQSDWPKYSAAARRTAERFLGVEQFVHSYQRLYEELLASSRISPSPPLAQEASRT